MFICAKGFNKMLLANQVLLLRSGIYFPTHWTWVISFINRRQQKGQFWAQDSRGLMYLLSRLPQVRAQPGLMDGRRLHGAETSFSLARGSQDQPAPSWPPSWPQRCESPTEPSQYCPPAESWTKKMFSLLRHYGLRDITGSVPDHLNKANIAIKWVTWFFFVSQCT